MLSCACNPTAEGLRQPRSPAGFTPLRNTVLWSTVLTGHICSCISLGTRKGYSITNCEPFGRVYARGGLDSIIPKDQLTPCSCSKVTVLYRLSKCCFAPPSSLWSAVAEGARASFRLSTPRCFVYHQLEEAVSENLSAEAIDHLRAHLSHINFGRQNESPSIGRRARRANLYLRYLQYEAVAHNRNLAKSAR